MVAGARSSAKDRSGTRSATGKKGSSGGDFDRALAYKLHGAPAKVVRALGWMEDNGGELLHEEGHGGGGGHGVPVSLRAKMRS